MSKTLLFRLFGVGKIPEKIRPHLEAEEIVVADEGIGGWYRTRDLKAPGKRFIRRREGFSGCLVITKKRLVCYTYRKRQISISVDDPKLAALFVDLPAPETLSLTFESSDFQDDWHGVIELQFKSDKARQFFDVLSDHGVHQGTAAAADTLRT